MPESPRLRWEGKGLHSGNACSVEVRATALPGIRFVFGDGSAFRVEEASCQGDGRGSTLSFPNGITIRTVEHLLSALGGMGFWNAEILVEGGEVPALDGSALPFASGISSFLERHEVAQPQAFHLETPVSARDPKNGRAIVILPAEAFGVSCVIDYPGTWIGTQAFHVGGLDPGTYLKEIAGAKTFCLESEVEALRAAGLGKGGTLDNTLVVGEKGPLNPQALTVPDSCARHKVLDLIGDLSLLGCPVVGHVLAYRSGHGLHLSLVSRLKRIIPRT